jgi:hypothetical protein
MLSFITSAPRELRKDDTVCAILGGAMRRLARVSGQRRSSYGQASMTVQVELLASILSHSSICINRFCSIL